MRSGGRHIIVVLLLRRAIFAAPVCRFRAARLRRAIFAAPACRFHAACLRRG